MEIVECSKCGKRSISNQDTIWWTCACNDNESVYKFFPPLELQEIQLEISKNDEDIEGYPI